MREDLRASVAGDMARTRADLERLVRIPSIAFPRSEEHTSELQSH